MSHVMFHVACVTCQVSRVICHLSGVHIPISTESSPRPIQSSCCDIHVFVRPAIIWFTVFLVDFFGSYYNFLEIFLISGRNIMNIVCFFFNSCLINLNYF